jgi:hypothetical protein
MQFDQLKRREVITLLAGTATWPLAAVAQQPALPVVAFVSGRSSGTLRALAVRSAEALMNSTMSRHAI